MWGLCPFLLPDIQFHTGLSGLCKDSLQVQPLPQINKMRYTLLPGRGGHPGQGRPRSPPLTLLRGRHPASCRPGGCVSPGPLHSVPAQSSDPCAPSSVDIWDRHDSWDRYSQRLQTGRGRVGPRGCRTTGCTGACGFTSPV